MIDWEKRAEQADSYQMLDRAVSPVAELIHALLDKQTPMTVHWDVYWAADRARRANERWADAELLELFDKFREMYKFPARAVVAFEVCREAWGG